MEVSIALPHVQQRKIVKFMQLWTSNIYQLQGSVAATDYLNKLTYSKEYKPKVSWIYQTWTSIKQSLECCNSI